MRKYLIASSLAFLAATGAASTQEACSSYTIKRGDSLRQLALRIYSTEDYRFIYDANRETIGSNPNVIRAGDTLVFPCLGIVGRATPEPGSEAERLAAEMVSELVKAAEEQAATAIAEAEAKAKKEIDAARAEGAALIRKADSADRPEIKDRQILRITGGDYGRQYIAMLNRGLNEMRESGEWWPLFPTHCASTMKK